MPPPSPALRPVPQVRTHSRRPLAAAFAAVAIFMLGISLGDGTTSAPVLIDEASAPATDAPTAPDTDEPTAAPTDEPSAPATDDAGAPATKESSAPATNEASAPAGSEPSAPATNARRVRPEADGGFSFGRQSHFRVSRDARSVIEFEANEACETDVRIPSIALASDGSFRYEGRLRAPGVGNVLVVVTGRFESPARARGTLRYRTPTCDTGRVRWVAELS
jgi:hypothetical protein